MTCDRCTDIHKAQREGKTQQECGCSCHIGYSTGTNTFTLTGGNAIFTDDTGLSSNIIHTDFTGNDVF